MNLSPLSDSPWNRQTIFPPSGIYHSRLLWFKIITMTIQSYVRETYYNRWQGCLRLRPQGKKDKPHPSANLRDLTQDTKHWHLEGKRPGCHVYSTINKEKEQNLSAQNTTWGCMLPHILRYIVPNCISEDKLTLNWKSRGHRCKQILTLLLLYRYFSVGFSWWNNKDVEILTRINFQTNLLDKNSEKETHIYKRIEF